MEAFFKFFAFSSNKENTSFFLSHLTSRSFSSIFTSNIGAQLGWHVFRLLRYVALPPPRVASSLYLATCLP
jgi:hypothetical protein